MTNNVYAKMYLFLYYTVYLWICVYDIVLRYSAEVSRQSQIMIVMSVNCGCS